MTAAFGLAPNRTTTAPADGPEAVRRADRAMGPRRWRITASVAGRWPGLAARIGDRQVIAAYLGGSGQSEQAVADFGVSYADQTERDHAAPPRPVASGRAEAKLGV